MPLSAKEMLAARQTAIKNLKDTRRGHLNTFIERELTNPHQTTALLVVNKEEADYISETYVPMGYEVTLKAQGTGAILVTIGLPFAEGVK